MSIRIKPYRVEERVTHFHPHPDEGLGFFLVQKFGGNVFLGAEDAPWVFLNAGQRPPNGQPIEQYQRTRLIIGTCLSKYDEHALNEDVRTRYAASTLVVRDLGVQDDPALKPILDYTVQNDRHGHRGLWDIASLMFSMNVSLPSPYHSYRTVDLAYNWYDVAYEYFRMQVEQGKKPEHPKGQLSLNDYIVAWLIREYDTSETIESAGLMSAADVVEKLGIADRPELKRILALAKRQHDGAADFDIFTFVEMAVAIGRSADWIFDQLTLMFNARRHEEKLFWKVRDQLPTIARFVQIWRNPANPDRPIIIGSTPADWKKVTKAWSAKRHKLLFTIGIIHSDSPVAHKAFRHAHKMDVMIIRKSNRYTAINLTRLPNGPFIFRLRKAEERRRLDWEELLRDGNTYGSDGKQRPWYNFKEGRWILNGAFTALDQNELPPTRLPLRRIVELTQEALLYIDELRRKTPRKNSKNSKKHGELAKKRSEPQFANNPHIRV